MRLRDRLAALLRLDDPPERVARALAVGVFIGCTPLWGLQTLLAVAVATGLGLNRAATVAGAWLNLPWIAPLVYGLAVEIGLLLLPGRVPALPSLRTPVAADWMVWARALSLPLLAGTTVVGAAAAVLTYVVARPLISRRRRDRGRAV